MIQQNGLPACPLCRGKLRLRRNSADLTFECPGGHVFGSDGILSAQVREEARHLRKVDAVLDSVIDLAGSLLACAREDGDEDAARFLEEALETARARADVVSSCLDPHHGE